MALFGSGPAQPSMAQTSPYLPPGTVPAQRPSALSTAGTLLDLLTGGYGHAVMALQRQGQARDLARQLGTLQAQDYADAGAMFRGPQVTTAPAAPVPDVSTGANLFAGGQYGAAPTQTFGGDSMAVTPGQIPSLEQFAPVAARLIQHGADPSKFLSLIQAAEPKMQVANGVAYDPRKIAAGDRIGVNLSPVNNTLIDTQNPANANRTIPQVDKGMVATYDANGQPNGVMNLPGNAAAQGDVAGAVATQQERAKAALDLVDVPMANGSTIKLPRDQAARLLGNGGVGSPAQAGGVGISQTPQDKTYADEQAKAAAARYQGIQTAGSQAPAKIAQYQELGRLFDGVNGNRLSPTGLELSRLGKSMGFSVDPKLGNKEAGVALANQIALTLRDPSSGGGMPGSMSNSDRQFLTNMVPNLAQSDAGRKQLVNIYIAKAARDKDTAQLARKWQQRYGRIDAPDANGATFEDQLQKWAEMHPLFGQH